MKIATCFGLAMMFAAGHALAGPVGADPVGTVHIVPFDKNFGPAVHDDVTLDAQVAYVNLSIREEQEATTIEMAATDSTITDESFNAIPLMIAAALVDSR